MTFAIVLSKAAQRFLDKLNDKETSRILGKLREAALDPFRYLEHYEGQGFKLRIGDFRALIGVDLQANMLFVRVLDKRGRIYK